MGTAWRNADLPAGLAHHVKIVSSGYGSIINGELFSMVNFWTQIKSTFRAVRLQYSTV